ncbi:coiled-coil domain-containing protein, partial [Angustibacter aerolatus]
MSSAARPRHALALTVTGALVAAVLTAGAAPALADPSGSGRPVYPSKQQVDDAKHAVTSKAGQVDAIQAQLAVASARLEQAQTAAEVAAEAYNAAKVELDQRTKAAQQARARATAAQQRADDAREAVGRLAVDTYVSGPQLGGIEVLAGVSSPQDLADHAAGVRLAGSITNQALGTADAAKVVAELMRRQADLALAQQQAAAARLERARQAAADRAGAAASEAASISAQRTSLIAQLASLQQTSVQLAEQRQAGLEEEARRRAEAARKAAAERAAAARRA